MRVFVTGAAGFIGKATTKELIANGHEVVGLARNDANVAIIEKMGAKAHRGDLTDLDSLKSAAKNADGVIHLAFIHDFSKFAENGQIDAHAIEAMGQVLEGTNKPLVVTSGVGMLAPGEIATEDMMRHQPGMPRMSEQAVFAFNDRSVKAMAVRLPQVHGGEGKAGFIGYLHQVAKEKGVSAYVGDGSNRWSAAHRNDVARLYRLALEKGETGKAYHAVADGEVPVKVLADLFAKLLNVPTRSITPEEAYPHFGFLGMFAGIDMPASSALTQQWLGWKPKEIGVIEDLSRPGYFAN
ncbi:MAG TPA: SDR family oxidoreductase [Rhizomicrobium sp.]|nr:SDR family oxidoreductase [Rhizomicrobium sp.]